MRFYDDPHISKIEGSTETREVIVSFELPRRAGRAPFEMTT